MANGDSFWRSMTADDLDAVGAMAAEVHPDLPERPEVFAEKLLLFRQGCFVLDSQAGAVGYAFAHPWRLRAIPPLDGFLTEIPPSANCLYLHDSVVLPAARGQAAAARLVDLLRAVAVKTQLPWLALVSVYGTWRLWGRFGFAPVEDAALAEKLVSYGETALYMTAPAR
jgi:GNAT superfamily N-acetyltransferase